jgi:hypothetical protein
MPTAEPATLAEIDIGKSFDVTVTIIPASAPAGDDGAAAPSEVISSVSGKLVGSPEEPNITITGGSNTVRITGKHINAFTDKFKYVESGKTDLIANVTEIEGRGSMPPDKNLYNLDQDRRKSITRTYELLVNNSITVPVTQDVLNALEPMRLFMANYNFNKSKDKKF